MFSQMVRAARLDRNFYSSLVFNDYAVGNAVLIIVLTGVVLFARAQVVSVALAAVYSLMRAGLSALAAWAVATLLYGYPGRLSTTFRLTGFAHTSFLLAAVATRLPESTFPEAALIVAWLASAFWYTAAMRVVAQAQYDVGGKQAWLIGLAGLAGWYVARGLGI